MTCLLLKNKTLPQCCIENYSWLGSVEKGTLEYVAK
jgi:hypothetical protein